MKFPGAPSYILGLNMVLAVLFPALGASRGLESILQHTTFAKNPIEQALHSSALCMVVRSPYWKPQPGNTYRDLSYLPTRLRQKDDDEAPYKALKKTRSELGKERFQDLKPAGVSIELAVQIPPWQTCSVVPPGHQVFGQCELPPGYELAYVPEDAQVEPLFDQELIDGEMRKTYFSLSSSYSLASAIIAIIQIIYASITLYRTRGEQVGRYGYAAFGFTVLPYLIMSFVNLLGNLLNPSYTVLYLVWTDLMGEAAERGGCFKGYVGKVARAPASIDNIKLFSGTFLEDNDSFWTFELDPTALNSDDIPSTMELKEEAAKCDLKGADPSCSIILTTSSTPDKASKRPPLIICPVCHNLKQVEQATGTWSTVQRFIRAPTPFRILLFLISALPFAVIGAMSHFNSGSSSTRQRGWTMTWLAVGTLVCNQDLALDLARGYFSTKYSRRYGRSKGRYRENIAAYLVEVIFLLVFAAPAVGGWVMVAQMLREYGSCSILH
ncbi:hypothetical protein EYZ11_010893 [Aspergillus tanneri]|uniref:Uncharacterized protein n=1 Tax=Aspergillus tanneri TaxID=1220188 RepID=A0A4S3J6D6_9EURO|nr:uncharacterized protein ATNIH1004_004714 [Aspergillus tanneri]KAA8648829.1 hypothetical protein ATNIH1004_004714 [Aspergillus tanneri]THC89667.1 hypothetical protein EYZ11_010893 [Aspergillus tanneri]